MCKNITKTTQKVDKSAKPGYNKYGSGPACLRGVVDMTGQTEEKEIRGTLFDDRGS